MFNSERKATVILVATTMIAALGWIFSKETIQGLPPFGFIGARFTIASLCLLPLCYRALWAANFKDVLSASGVGLLLGSAVMTWIYAISISDTLGEGAFIMSLSMLFVPIVAWVMFRQRPQRIFWIALPIAVLGLACLSLVGGWKQSASQFWFLGAALILALHFNVNRKYSQTLPVLLLTCVQLFSAGCLGLLVSYFMESFPTKVDSSIWWWFALSTLLATSLRYVMQTMGQKFVQAGNAALIMILEPVWTVILSVLWYGEVLTANKLVGCVLILFSLIIYRTGGRLRLPTKA